MLPVDAVLGRRVVLSVQALALPAVQGWVSQPGPVDDQWSACQVPR
jgi:hypothetical protein